MSRAAIEAESVADLYRQTTKHQVHHKRITGELHQLPELTQAMIQARAKGARLEQVAKEFGVSRGTAGKRIARAMHQIHRMLTGEQPSPQLLAARATREKSRTKRLQAEAAEARKKKKK